MNAVFTINGKQIETERLILRAFCQDDLEDFYQYASVQGVGERAGWFHHKSREESQSKLDSFVLEDQTFAICLKSNNKVIGSLGVKQYGLEDKLTEFTNYQGRELGFVLSKDYWNKGIMTEAVKAVINYLFNECHLDFLTCGHFISNTSSQRVQQKCGFKPYRKLVCDTNMGTQETTILNLLVNPRKEITFNFSHPETLIWQD